MKFLSDFVVADERSEAASGCEATVKPEPGIYLNERSVRFYERCVAVAHQLDRSLAPLVSDYRKTVNSRTYPAFASNWNIGFALTASPFCQTATKGTKKALPLAYGLRCAQVPSRRLAPWARRHGPSLAHRGSPGIHAGRPTPQNLLSASRWGGRSKADQKPPRRPTGRPVGISVCCYG
ncbi:hypothetical protein CJU73_21290 [Pseudomonas fragi]|nr:hypothetical protein CJU73_21290 [Pseudomonas fragi]